MKLLLKFGQDTGLGFAFEPSLPIAEVRPETMNGPTVLGQQLALLFKSCICVPELSLQDQTARSWGATCVQDGCSILARVERRLEQAGGQARESGWEKKLPCSKYRRCCHQDDSLEQPRGPGHRGRERSSPSLAK